MRDIDGDGFHCPVDLLVEKKTGNALSATLAVRSPYSGGPGQVLSQRQVTEGRRVDTGF
jgi:hypothetical protein